MLSKIQWDFNLEYINVFKSSSKQNVIWNGQCITVRNISYKQIVSYWIE